MIKWRRLPLRNQFFLIFVTIQFAIFLLLFFYFTTSLKSFHYKSLEKELMHQAQLIMENPLLKEYQRDFNNLDKWIKELGKKIGTRITLIDSRGLVLGDSVYAPEKMDNHRRRPEIRALLEEGQEMRVIRTSNTLDQDMFYLAVKMQEEDEVSIIRLSQSLKEIKSLQYQGMRSYLLFFMGTFILTLIIIWKYSSTITTPLGELTRAAKEMAKGNLHERIGDQIQENEIGELGRMFNYMASKLERTIQDISQEKGRAEAILTSMADGVIATDPSQEITLFNPKAVQLARLKNGNVKGKRLMEVFRNYRLQEKLKEVMEKNITTSEEIILPGLEKRHLRCNFAPVVIQGNQVIGGVILMTDITELRHLEQVRKDFVANVSHELRTPLTSIIGYLDTLMDGDLEEEEVLKKFLGIIKTEADRLALLIKDLLDLSKIERDTDRYKHLEQHNLTPLMEKTFAIFQGKATKKGINLKIAVEENLPLVFMIPQEIEQVLINLLDNAIKYTNEGSIQLRAYQREGKVTVELIDTGIGIPKKDQDRIFERFYRVHKARSRSLGGTGIGLAIVKHILMGHGSQIQVESTKEEGSLFRFHLRS